MNLMLSDHLVIKNYLLVEIIIFVCWVLFISSDSVDHLLNYFGVSCLTGFSGVLTFCVYLPYMQFKIARVSAGSVTVVIFLYSRFKRRGFSNAQGHRALTKSCFILLYSILFYFLYPVANKTKITRDLAYVPLIAVYMFSRARRHVYPRLYPVVFSFAWHQLQIFN